MNKEQIKDLLRGLSEKEVVEVIKIYLEGGVNVKVANQAYKEWLEEYILLVSIPGIGGVH